MQELLETNYQQDARYNLGDRLFDTVAKAAKIHERIRQLTSLVHESRHWHRCLVCGSWIPEDQLACCDESDNERDQRLWEQTKIEYDYQREGEI